MSRRRRPSKLARRAQFWRAQAAAATDAVERQCFEENAERLERQLAEMDRCAMCGASLTDSESIARGYGPDCWAKLKKAGAEA